MSDVNLDALAEVARGEIPGGPWARDVIAALIERVRVAEAAVARGLALADSVDADARKYQHLARLGTGDLRAALTTPTPVEAATRDAAELLGRIEGLES